MGSENDEYKDVSGLTSQSNGFGDFAKIVCVIIVIAILLYFGFVYLMIMIGH